jgi:hypothetical protein
MWDDIVDESQILEKVPKERLSQYVNPYFVGRKFKVIAYRLGVLIVKSMFKHIINRLMESEIFNMGYRQRLFIGSIPNNPNRIAKQVKKDNVPWHTMRRRYAVVMESEGKRLSVQFRMPQRRRQELADRILKGQRFYT